MGSNVDTSGVAGIWAGDHWTDSAGVRYVVTWVRRMGILGYRREDDPDGDDEVIDMVRFVTRFAPADTYRAA